MSTPYIGFSNDTLDRQPRAHEGQLIACPTCGKRHRLAAGTRRDGSKDTLLLFYKCGDASYLAAVGGALVAGLKADVSGEIGDHE